MGKATQVAPRGFRADADGVPDPPARVEELGIDDSVFVTDETHQPSLVRQLTETEELIARSTAAFQERHARPMPEDNPWLAQRRAEHAALTRLLATMQEKPGRAIQGGGCRAVVTGPVPLALDHTRQRRTQP